MIKLIIFDLDGVLVDARELHYNALNDALFLIDEKYIINKQSFNKDYLKLSIGKKRHFKIELN